MVRKNTVKQLQERIRSMVKEEIVHALKEEMNPLFRRIRNKRAFSAWVMRQFFNPAKHKNKVWYDPSVNEDNVLEKISELSEEGTFPTSPNALVSTWHLKGQLNTALGKAESEEKLADKKAIKDAEEEQPSGGTKRRGEATYTDIGAELGGVSKTYINKLSDKSMEDFKTLNLGKHPDLLTPDEKEMIDVKIEKARTEAADEFVDRLHAASSVKDFLDDLLKTRVLAPVDMKIITPEELDGLEILKSKDPDRVKMILLQDINDDDNLFKSFQSMVAIKAIPHKKRGRPKKQS